MKLRHMKRCIFMTKRRKGKKKITIMGKILFEQARCPRCDYKGVYSYTRNDGCCRYCAYPYGDKSKLYA